MRVTVVVLAIALFSFQAWATPVDLEPSSPPFSAGDPFIQTWLIATINAYNTAHGTTLSTASVEATPEVKVNTNDSAPPGYPSFGSDTLTIDLPGNLNDYLVLHWGGPGGGVYQAFDLTTTPEVSDTFPAPGRNGLSFYSFYGDGNGDGQTPIPEPATMLLLGSGLIGLAGYGRKKLFKK